MKNNTVFCSVLGLIGAALVIRGSMLPAGPPCAGCEMAGAISIFMSAFIYFLD